MGAGVLSWSRLISLRAQLHRHIEHCVVHSRQAAFAAHLVCLPPVSPVPRLQLCALRSAPRSPQLRQAKSFPLMSTFTGSPTDSVELDERLLPFLHGLGDSYARPPQLDRERTGVPSNSAMLSGCVSSAPSFPNTLVPRFRSLAFRLSPPSASPFLHLDSQLVFRSPPSLGCLAGLRPAASYTIVLEFARAPGRP